jgi:large subunit ribosomal protein L22
MVDGGRVIKRMRPAPQGRGYRVRKRSNHVTIIVDSKNYKGVPSVRKTLAKAESIEEVPVQAEQKVVEPKKAATKKATAKKETTTKTTTKKEKTAEEKTEKKSPAKKTKK